MTGFRPELKFVPVEQPSRGTKPGDAFALRSHVRRMIALDKASRPQPTKVKFVPVTTPFTGTSGQKKRTKAADGTNHAHKLHSRKALHDTSRGDSGYDIITEEASALTTRLGTAASNVSFASPYVYTNPLQYHPFATMAARYVDLSIRRLDLLFKSEAFRHAAEPLFDTSHVDSSMNMSSVFPLCLSSRAFFNALIYSIVQAFNCGKTTLEQLKLHSKTITALKDTLGSDNSSLTAASVGTIMILRGAAYKWEDYATHELHAKGLTRALQAVGDCLTPAASRALFWQDLFASILISAPRNLTHDSLPDRICWKRSQKVYDDGFPKGFLRHRDVLPDDLLDCIQDLIELQTAAANCTHSGPERHIRLEPLQADIESRLAFQAKSCERFGIIASATRLAVFIITYTAYMDTWSFSLIPGRLAEQLVRLLEASMWSAMISGDEKSCYAWSTHSDLLLWLLFVGLSAAESDGGVIEGLRDRYAQVLCSYRAKASTDCWAGVARACQSGTPQTLPKILKSTLDDYIYPVGWVQRRLKIRTWAELEGWMQSPSLAEA